MQTLDHVRIKGRGLLGAFCMEPSNGDGQEQDNAKYHEHAGDYIQLQQNRSHVSVSAHKSRVGDDESASDSSKPDRCVAPKDNEIQNNSGDD